MTTTQRILAMREHGHPIGTIAARFGLDYGQVFDVLRTHGAAEDWLCVLYGDHSAVRSPDREVRATARTARDDDIAAAYQRGDSLRKICAAFRAGPKTVYAVLDKRDIPRRMPDLPPMSAEQKQVYRKLRRMPELLRDEAVASALGAP